MAIEQAGGDLRTATITRGGVPGEIDVTAVRAPGAEPPRLLEAIIATGDFQSSSREDVLVEGRRVTILVLPPYAADRAYLVTVHDTVVLIYTSPDDLAFEVIRALP